MKMSITDQYALKIGAMVYKKGTRKALIKVLNQYNAEINAHQQRHIDSLNEKLAEYRKFKQELKNFIE